MLIASFNLYKRFKNELLKRESSINNTVKQLRHLEVTFSQVINKKKAYQIIDRLL
jgi:hypothetical protein